MKKTDIMIDVANIEKIQMIIRTAYESAELFVKNFDKNIWSPDFAMYNSMESLMKMIQWIQGEPDCEEMKIFYKMDGDMRCAHFEDFVNIQQSVAWFWETKEKAKRNLFVNLYGWTNLQYA